MGAGRRTHDRPVLLSWKVPYDSLADLESLSFADAGPSARDYWEFVTHCRTQGGPHRHAPKGWFSLVVGPVAGNWKAKQVRPDYDQMSFHDPDGIGLLNGIDFHQEQFALVRVGGNMRR